MQIWEFVTNEAGRIEPQCVCDLTRHQSSVSAVRWSPDGKLLASADLGELSKDMYQQIETNEWIYWSRHLSSSVGEIVLLHKLKVYWNNFRLLYKNWQLETSLLV